MFRYSRITKFTFKKCFCGQQHLCFWNNEVEVNDFYVYTLEFGNIQLKNTNMEQVKSQTINREQIDINAQYWAFACIIMLI